jgi:hypothetical protein
LDAGSLSAREGDAVVRDSQVILAAYQEMSLKKIKENG